MHIIIKGAAVFGDCVGIQPIDEVNGPNWKCGQRVCHDPLPWLICFSLDDYELNRNQS